jgi:hypothetical protein
MVGHSSAMTLMLLAYLTGYQSRLQTLNNKETNEEHDKSDLDVGSRPNVGTMFYLQDKTRHEQEWRCEQDTQVVC